MLNEIAVSATPAVDSLSFIAQRINDHHGQATRHAKTAIEHARQAGELLLEAKALVNHGEWIGWLADNCAVSPRQAQRYMRVATHWELIAKNDAASHLTIDDALQVASNRIAVEDDPTSEELWTGKIEALPLGKLLFGSFRHGFVTIFQSSRHPGYYHCYSYLVSPDFEGGEAQETRRPMKACGLAMAMKAYGMNPSEFNEADQGNFTDHDIEGTLPYSQDFYRQLGGSR